jgi:hypothetical protein
MHKDTLWRVHVCLVHRLWQAVSLGYRKGHMKCYSAMHVNATVPCKEFSEEDILDYYMFRKDKCIWRKPVKTM